MISVIIPTFNAEKSIERAVESILNQTYQDFEIIICDDCSSDRTWDILKKISKKDKRIK
ncbi:glycosyltransferase family 2 protein, partial [Enterococcus faecium]|nr:glycosyltransferase family 2 protein [Enterococcus faecium]